MEDYPHQIPIRVYYEDTDAGGIVYYANYLKFFERGRTEWLRDLGIDQQMWLRENIAFVVRHIDMDNIMPGKFNDLLNVKSRLESVKKASVVFEQAIFNSEQQLLAKARVKVACVNLDKMKPVGIPKPIYEELVSVV